MEKENKPIHFYPGINEIYFGLIPELDDTGFNDIESMIEQQKHIESMIEEQRQLEENKKKNEWSNIWSEEERMTKIKNNYSQETVINEWEDLEDWEDLIEPEDQSVIIVENVNETAINNGHILSLPSDMIKEIIEYLNLKNILFIFSTSKEFNIRYECIWEHKFCLDFISSPKLSTDYKYHYCKWVQFHDYFCNSLDNIETVYSKKQILERARHISNDWLQYEECNLCIKYNLTFNKTKTTNILHHLTSCTTDDYFDDQKTNVFDYMFDQNLITLKIVIEYLENKFFMIDANLQQIMGLIHAHKICPEFGCSLITYVLRNSKSINSNNGRCAPADEDTNPWIYDESVWTRNESIDRWQYDFHEIYSLYKEYILKNKLWAKKYIKVLFDSLSHNDQTALLNTNQLFLEYL